MRVDTADMIRARGVSIEYECDECRKSKAMDDLHRLSHQKLKAEIDAACLRCASLVDIIIAKDTREAYYQLAIFALVIVSGFALASDAGWFK